MTTDGQLAAEPPDIPDAFADAWAAVYIDVYEKLKERGELPDDPSESTSPQNGEKLPADKQTDTGASPCPST